MSTGARNAPLHFALPFVGNAALGVPQATIPAAAKWNGEGAVPYTLGHHISSLSTGARNALLHFALPFVGEGALALPKVLYEPRGARGRAPLHTRPHISSFIHGRTECAPTFCLTICRERRPRRSTGDILGCGEMERRGRRSLHIGTSYIIVIHGRTMCAPAILIRPRSGHHNYALRITNYALNKIRIEQN